MKTKAVKITLIVLGLMAVVLIAMRPPFFSGGDVTPGDEVPIRPSGQPREFTPPELAALEEFLTMSDEELDRLQSAIDRIRAMSEEERAQFAGRIVEFRRLPREERQRMREGFGRQSFDERDDWRRMMQDLTPEERRSVHESLQDIPGDERTQRRLRMIEEWREER